MAFTLKVVYALDLGKIKQGNTRYSTEVLCDNLEMLGRRRSDQAENTKMAKEPELPTPETGDDLPF